MSKSKYTDVQIKSYLLQTMDPAEREQLERAMFEDDDLAMDLYDVEEELMEKYSSNTLDSESKEQFERIYTGNTSNLHHLRLYQFLSTPQNDRNPLAINAMQSSIGLKQGLAFLLLILLVAMIAVLFNQNLRLRSQIHSPQAEPNTIQKKNQENKPKPKDSGALTQNVAVALLSPFVFRQGADSSHKIDILESTDVLLLKLALQKRKEIPYQLKVLTIDDSVVYFCGPSFITMDSGQPVVSFTLPVRKIQRGDYIARLEGQISSGQVEEVAEYYFRLEKELENGGK